MVMHKIPPYLSKNEFETKLEALIDNALQLPLVQENLFKVEMVRILILIHTTYERLADRSFRPTCRMTMSKYLHFHRRRRLCWSKCIVRCVWKLDYGVSVK
jgi:hypothetical protein